MFHPCITQGRFAAASAVSIALAVAAFGQDHPYEVTDLGTLGGSASSASAVNELGQVVGSSATLAGTSHAFLWNPDGSLIDLGTLGGEYSFGASINEAGQVVGWSTLPSNSYRAFVWEDGVMTSLPTLGGDAHPYDINNRGEVVGESWNGSAWHAVRWTVGSPDMVDMGTLGGRDSTANSINDLGQVTGYSDLPSFFRHAFLWTEAGGIQDLGTLGGGESFGYAINVAGQIVGTADNEQNKRHAFLYEDGAMIDLRLLPGDRVSWASGINDAGLAVGYSYYNYDPHFPVDQFAVAFDAGIPIDLNCLADLPSNTALEWATAINHAGQIAGTARIGSGKFSTLHRAFLLSPVEGALTVEDPVPGVAGEINSITVRNATPGSAVEVLYALASTCTPVPGCNGTTVALRNPARAGRVGADAAGEATLTAFVPAAAAGHSVLLQAVEWAACRVSHVNGHVFMP